MALGRGARHRAGREEGLVVGMGVERHERAGHRRPSSRMAGWTPVKVALLSDCYPPRLGGIERQVHDLAHHLAAAGHRVEVFTATTGPGGERHGVRTAEDDGVVVHRMALPLPSGVPVNPLAPPEVRRRLDAGGFDVAHAHLGVVSPFATDLVRTALAVGLPVAATFHCVLGRWVPAFRAAGHLGRWARRGVALSAVSRMAAAQVGEAAGGAPGRGAGQRGRRGVVGGPDAEPRRDRRPSTVARRHRHAAGQPQAPARAPRGAAPRPRAARPRPSRCGSPSPGRARSGGRWRPTCGHAGTDWVALPGRLDREALRDLLHAGDALRHGGPARGLRHRRPRGPGGRAPRPGARGHGRRRHRHRRRRRPARRLRRRAGPGRRAARRGRRPADRARGPGPRESPPRQDWPAVLDATLAEYRRAGAAS